MCVCFVCVWRTSTLDTMIERFVRAHFEGQVRRRHRRILYDHRLIEAER